MPPQELQAGYVSAARNKRFRTTGANGTRGRCMTRDGIALLPWMKTNGRTPFSEVYGAFVFQDVNQGGQWILMAADGGIWKTRPSYVATPVPLPGGVTLTRGTFRKFVQSNGVILLLRGVGQDTLQCTNLEEGFKPIVQLNVWGVTFDHSTNWVGLADHNLLVGDPVRFTVGSGTALPVSVTADKTYYVLDTPNGDAFTISTTPGDTTTQVIFSTGAGDAVIDIAQVRLLDGAEPIPPCEDGIAFGNRAILVRSVSPGTLQDRLLVTDIGDVTRAQILGSEFRINLGDGFSLETVRIFNADTLVCFKSGNVLKVDGVSGDLSQAVGPSNVTDAYGAVGPLAVASFGNQIYWLNSELRITSLQLTALNQDQSTDVGLSDPLVKTFGRINGTYAANSRLVVYDGFLLCALPLDEAQVVDGTELVPAGQQYASGTISVAVTTTAGQTYKYFQGPTGGRLVNGTETLAGDSDFVAQGVSVSLYAAAAYPFPITALCQDSVKLVRANGANTAVAVYDFLNGAWAGSDEASGVTHVVDWLKFDYGGRPRLGFMGADGWLHLYGEGYEDDYLAVVPQPYVDVIVQDYSKLGTGDTVQVNGGTIASARSTDGFNQTSGVGTRWGVFGSTGGANLWRDANGVGGFDATSTGPWTCPNCTASQVGDGVRFTATNGVVPVVNINGAPVADGLSDWAMVDSFSGSTVQSVPIVDLVRTRAYRCVMMYGSLSETGRMRRYLQAAALIGTWSPKYSLTAIVQGQNATNEVLDQETRDRSKYFAPFDAADFDQGNPLDKFDDPRREDYSWPDPGLGLLIGSGVTWDAIQEYVHRVPVSENGLWLQLEIENEDGRLELIATAMESQGGQILAGPAVA